MFNTWFTHKSLSRNLFGLFLFGLTMFPRLEVYLLAFLFVLWLMEKNYRTKLSFLKQNKHYLILPLLYLVYLLGMLYTENMKAGTSLMETRFSLLLLPVILPTFFALKIKKHHDSYLKSYLAGVILSMLVCIVRAIVLFSHEMYCRKYGIELLDYPYTNYFFSGHLSYFMHYGYYAMYVNVAIILLLDYAGKKFSVISKGKKLAVLLLLFALSVFVLMLYSKAGILSLLLIYSLFGFYLLLKYRSLKYILYTAATLFIILFILFNYIPHTTERIDGMLKGISSQEADPESGESTQLRTFAWKASMQLIKDRPLLGYGTGDANDVLINEYKEKRYAGALRKELNTHNQYFQTMLAIGLLGVLILLLFFVNLIYSAFSGGTFSLLAFSLITPLAFLFESYIETQAGVFYTVVFATWFLIVNTNKPEELSEALSE